MSAFGCGGNNAEMIDEIQQSAMGTVFNMNHTHTGGASTADTKNGGASKHQNINTQN